MVKELTKVSNEEIKPKNNLVQLLLNRKKLINWK